MAKGTDQVGKALYPPDGRPIRIAQIAFEGDKSTDFVMIGAAEDGRWFVDDAGVKTYDTPQQLASQIWRDGHPGERWLEVLFELGWLTLDHAAVEKAQQDAFPSRSSANVDR